jgi:hypothetical protein
MHKFLKIYFLNSFMRLSLTCALVATFNLDWSEAFAATKNSQFPITIEVDWRSDSLLSIGPHCFQGVKLPAVPYSRQQLETTLRRWIDDKKCTELDGGVYQGVRDHPDFHISFVHIDKTIPRYVLVTLHNLHSELAPVKLDEQYLLTLPQSNSEKIAKEELLQNSYHPYPSDQSSLDNYITDQRRLPGGGTPPIVYKSIAYTSHETTVAPAKNANVVWDEAALVTPSLENIQPAANDVDDDFPTHLNKAQVDAAGQELLRIWLTRELGFTPSDNGMADALRFRLATLKGWEANAWSVGIGGAITLGTLGIMIAKGVTVTTILVGSVTVGGALLTIGVVAVGATIVYVAFTSESAYEFDFRVTNVGVDTGFSLLGGLGSGRLVTGGATLPGWSKMPKITKPELLWPPNPVPADLAWLPADVQGMGWTGPNIPTPTSVPANFGPMAMMTPVNGVRLLAAPITSQNSSTALLALRPAVALRPLTPLVSTLPSSQTGMTVIPLPYSDEMPALLKASAEPPTPPIPLPNIRTWQEYRRLYLDYLNYQASESEPVDFLTWLFTGGKTELDDKIKPTILAQRVALYEKIFVWIFSLTPSELDELAKKLFDENNIVRFRFGKWESVRDDLKATLLPRSEYFTIDPNSVQMHESGGWKWSAQRIKRVRSAEEELGNIMPLAYYWSAFLNRIGIEATVAANFLQGQKMTYGDWRYLNSRLDQLHGDEEVYFRLFPSLLGEIDAVTWLTQFGNHLVPYTYAGHFHFHEVGVHYWVYALLTRQISDATTGIAKLLSNLATHPQLQKNVELVTRLRDSAEAFVEALDGATAVISDSIAHLLILAGGSYDGAVRTIAEKLRPMLTAPNFLESDIDMQSARELCDYLLSSYVIDAMEITPSQERAIRSLCSKVNDHVLTDAELEENAKEMLQRLGVTEANYKDFSSMPDKK